MKNKTYKLKNGLRVLLVESRKSPVVSVQMWVRTGSADEKKGEEGISHFIEHLLFKGTRKYKTGEIASLVEGNGGELNAYTSYDQTVFYVTIEAQKRKIALDVISEMMGFPLFDPEEINNERGVVIEEIKRGEDSLSSVAWKNLFSTVYTKHNYKEPIIGYEKNIKSLSPKKIKNFYQSRYVPSNMFLVVTGDFDSTVMKKEVAEHFEIFKAFKLDKRTRKKEPLQKKSRINVIKTKFKKTQSYLAWRAPSIKHKDVPALDLLSMILGTGDSSRLSKKLRIDNLIVQGVGSFAYTPKDDGVFAISLSGEESKLTEGIRESLAVSLEILKTPPSAAEMKKALAISSSESIYSLETVDGLSRKIGNDEFYMNDPDYFQKYLKALYKVKPVDVSKAARKYLNPKSLTTVYLTENSTAKAKSEIEEIMKWYSVEYQKVIKSPLKLVKFSAKPVTIKKSSQVLSKTKIMNRPSGLTLVLKTQSDTPTFSIRAAALGGLRAEKPEHSGAIELLSRTWTAGSKKYNEDQINEIIESHSAGLSAFGGRNTIGLTLDGLSSSQEELYQVYFDLLTAPTWPRIQVGREKHVQLHQIENKKDNPAQICFQQFHEMMFKNHPYARDVLGQPDLLKEVHSDVLQNYFEKLICLKNLVITAVGDFDEKLLMSFIESLESKLPKGSKFSTVLPLAAIQKNESRVTALEKEQTHIVLGYPGLQIDSNHRFVLDVLQSVLSGQGGRLFYELRDKNSLAYSVSPIRMEGLEPGYFGTYIGCSPEKKDKAIAMMRDELKKLTISLITEDELVRAKNYLIGQQAISLQKKSTIAQAIVLDVIYGMSPDHVFEIIEEYKKVTREDILALAKTLFSQPEVLSVVGPVSK